jgi:hypothetical protein
MFHQRLLQRYMLGERALQVLNDDGLYFRRIDGYPEDPTEGDREYFGSKEQLILDSLNSRFSDDTQMTPEEAKQLCQDAMHRDKQSVFIQSWFWHKQMSRFMWENYGKFSDNPDCALFIVDLFKVGNYLDRELPVGYRFETVKYVQDKQRQREAFFTKRIEFEPEREYRISINVGELISFNKKILPDFQWPPRHMEVYCEDDFAKNYRNRGVANEDLFTYVDEFGFILKTPLIELLEAVYIPTSASAEFCNQLNDLLESKGYAFKCQRVELPLE